MVIPRSAQLQKHKKWLSLCRQIRYSCQIQQVGLNKVGVLQQFEPLQLCDRKHHIWLFKLRFISKSQIYFSLVSKTKIRWFYVQHLYGNLIKDHSHCVFLIYIFWPGLHWLKSVQSLSRKRCSSTSSTDNINNVSYIGMSQIQKPVMV